MSTTRLVFEDMKPIWFSNGSLMRYLLVVFALTFGISQPIYAQPSQDEIYRLNYQKSIEDVKNAEYIFEGYFRYVPFENCKGYHLGDSAALFVSKELTIVHCYKGGLKPGTVKLVRPVPIEEHVFGIGYNKKFVFICQTSNYPDCDSVREYDNPQSLKLFSEYFTGRYTPGFGFDFKSDSVLYKVAGLYKLRFQTIEEFHSFLMEASDGISLPTILSPKVCQTEGETGPLPDDHRMILQPNPARYYFSIFYTGALPIDNHRIQVFTSGGNLIESMNISEDTGSITLYTSYWLPGIYLVVFRNDSGVIDTDELLILH